MSDLVHKAHADAGLNLLRAVPQLDARVFDGKPTLPLPEPPYVVVYVNVARPRGEVGAANTLNGQSVTYVTTYTCHCVGLTAEAARSAQMLVDDTFADIKPTISGRACGQIGQDDILPAASVESTGRDVYDAISIYSFISAPG